MNKCHLSITFCSVLVLISLSMLNVAQAAGTPLYWQRVEQAQPDNKALADSKKLVKEHKDVDIIERTRIRPFHKQPAYAELSSNAFCMNCHLPIPHTKNLRSRTFLNMHTNYIACESCHFRPEDVNLDYRWFNFETQQIQPASSQLFKVIKPKDAEQKKAFTERNPLIKITPFFNQMPAILFKDSIQPKALLQQWNDGDLQQRTEVRAKIHVPLEPKGPKCIACHDADEQQFNLEQLGASPQQIKAISLHRIPLFFSRYKEKDQKIRIIDVLR
ncbi:MAG: multiheme c-type cytochrome [Methylococcales bacterium]